MHSAESCDVLLWHHFDAVVQPKNKYREIFIFSTFRGMFIYEEAVSQLNDVLCIYIRILNLSLYKTKSCYNWKWSWCEISTNQPRVIFYQDVFLINYKHRDFDILNNSKILSADNLIIQFITNFKNIISLFQKTCKQPLLLDLQLNSMEHRLIFYYV